MHIKIIQSVFALAIVFLHCGPARAHFLFLHMVQGDDPRIELHFAESAWDFSSDSRMVGLIATTSSWDAKGEPIEFDLKRHAMVAPLPKGMDSATSAFTYGLMSRGTTFLLEYRAKGVSGIKAAARPSDLDAEIIAVPDGAGNLRLTVLFRGKPAPGAEIIVPLSGAMTRTMATDEAGQLVIPMPKTPIFSIRAMVAESKDGVHDGEAYGEVRYYTTLTVQQSQHKADHGDSLAWSILGDAYGCLGMYSDDGMDWKGRIGGNFGNEELRGSMSHDGQRLNVSHPSTMSAAAVAQLGSTEGMPGPWVLDGHQVRFDVNRTPGVGSTITVPGQGLTYVILDRRIKSVLERRDSGARRIDVLAWETTEEDRLVPAKWVVTEFGSEGGIESVAMIDSTFTRQGGIHVPQRHVGSLLSGVDGATDFSIQLSDVKLDGGDDSGAS